MDYGEFPAFDFPGNVRQVLTVCEVCGDAFHAAGTQGLCGCGGARDAQGFPACGHGLARQGLSHIAATGDQEKV